MCIKTSQAHSTPWHYNILMRYSTLRRHNTPRCYMQRDVTVHQCLTLYQRERQRVLTDASQYAPPLLFRLPHRPQNKVLSPSSQVSFAKTASRSSSLRPREDEPFPRRAGGEAHTAQENTPCSPPQVRAPLETAIPGKER